MARAEPGVVEWFLLGERERAERVAATLRALGVERLRTGLSWADWHVEGGADWYRELLPRLAADVELLPCITYTPPSLGVREHVSAPPRRLDDYADFVEQALDEFGGLFEHVELWNEPNNLSDWDWRIDTDWSWFGEMVGEAAARARRAGKRVVLGGPSPLDPGWLDAVGRHGLLAHVDAVGLHGFPGTWEPHWSSWEHELEQVRAVLGRHGAEPELWVTETGFSTWRGDEHSQVRTLAEVLALPVERIYWYAAEDLDHGRATMDGVQADPRDYHFGLAGSEGEKLLGRLWREGGLPLVREVAALCPAPEARRHRGPAAAITGGAGAEGAALAERLLADGRRVLVLDSLRRPGAERTLLRLRRRHGADSLAVEVADARDPYAVRRALAAADEVFHLAPEGEENVRAELGRLAEPPPLRVAEGAAR